MTREEAFAISTNLLVVAAGLTVGAVITTSET
jgi:hypothetical protein